MDILKKLLSTRYAPRWLVLQIDILISLAGVVFGYLVRFNLNTDNPEFRNFWWALGTYALLRLAGFYYFRTYNGILRYTSTQDAKRIFWALISGTATMVFFNLAYWFALGRMFLPFTVILLEFIISGMAMMSFRLGIRLLYAEWKRDKKVRSTVAIYGAGESGIITRRTIDQDKDSRKRVVAYFDDDPAKWGKFLDGVKIYNPDADMVAALDKADVSELIIAIQRISRERKEQIVDLCLRAGVQVKTVPPANDWVNGALSLKQIQNVKIEDLLEREPIKLDQDRIADQIHGQVVLVTGACGSIGSELVRQVLKFYPEHLILVDQAETPLYELQLELEEHFNFVKFTPVVGDVRCGEKMERIIKAHRPSIIYHAAAYKHVPLMEANPAEAVRTNIQGTRVMADLALKYGADKFIFVSTDKAVNPTNVMGASKRIAEIYVQSLNTHYAAQGKQHTRFITTRFGNVLGSNGSVIPRFRKQIEEGGPITVTHPEISRFFMTIPEACQLILEAGMMGKGGEIYVFDMGESVKIDDLARKMIHLSGLTVEKDIRIVYTGLRPGEKIKEELLNNKEKTMPTHHRKILVGKVREYPLDIVKKEIDELISLIGPNDNELVAQMKRIVPEFVSNNSAFSSLDRLDLTPSDLQKPFKGASVGMN